MRSTATAGPRFAGSFSPAARRRRCSSGSRADRRLKENILPPSVLPELEGIGEGRKARTGGGDDHSADSVGASTVERLGLLDQSVELFAGGSIAGRTAILDEDKTGRRQRIQALRHDEVTAPEPTDHLGMAEAALALVAKEAEQFERPDRAERGPDEA